MWSEQVETINSVGEAISGYFDGSRGYIGYVDYCLPRPGSDYFGPENTAKLSVLREKFDPNGILLSNSSKYLFVV